MKLGYPTAPNEFRENLAYKRFRDFFNDHEMEWTVCQGSAENIDEALNLTKPSLSVAFEKIRTVYGSNNW